MAIACAIPAVMLAYYSRRSERLTEQSRDAVIAEMRIEISGLREEIVGNKLAIDETQAEVSEIKEEVKEKLP